MCIHMYTYIYFKLVKLGSTKRWNGNNLIQRHFPDLPIYNPRNWLVSGAPCFPLQNRLSLQSQSSRWNPSLPLTLCVTSLSSMEWGNYILYSELPWERSHRRYDSDQPHVCHGTSSTLWSLSTSIASKLTPHLVLLPLNSSSKLQPVWIFWNVNLVILLPCIKSFSVSVHRILSMIPKAADLPKPSASFHLWYLLLSLPSLPLVPVPALNLQTSEPSENHKNFLLFTRTLCLDLPLPRTFFSFLSSKG